MKALDYREIDGGLPFYMLVGAIGVFVLAALGAAFYMEHNGHWVTGMNNQIVWGTPHVFAVFLIVAASGALNVASISSVFSKAMYKPLARLSGLLAITLLVGGLAVLVLDLGHPDRLIVAMTYYNFKSIFAWNIMLYTGFMGIVAIYLWMMMERKMNQYTKIAGFTAFIWRLTLTTGTGSIFGFLVARQAYDAAIMAPMFIIMSFSFGLAIFILVLMGLYRWSNRPLGDAIVYRLKNLLGVFIAAVLYFVMAYHLTNLYATENHGVERFILMDGGVYTQMVGIVQVGIGSLLPLLLLFGPAGKSRLWIGIACLLTIIGGLAQIYVIIIGGQAYPMEMFPGKEVIESSFFDGVVGSYTPSLPEFVLGIGGIALALVATVVGTRVLRFLPVSLADDQVDPHHSAADAA
jgi:molybdopterin-containing oxidoreductase family membrane subunit